MDRQKLIDNIVSVAKIGLTYGLPIIHSTVNVKTRLNKRPSHIFVRFSAETTRSIVLNQRLGRCGIRSGRQREWPQETHYGRAVDRGLLELFCAGRSERGLRSVRGGRRGRGPSVEAHEAILRRIERAGGKMMSWMQLLCELQRDWARKETVPAFMNIAFEVSFSVLVEGATN